jgi:hypothetical protein
MADEIEGPTDLLGDPLRPLPDRRGRRKLRFHAEVYEKVERLRASGMTQEEIAEAINISIPTLRRYFFPELTKADLRVRGDIVNAVLAKALEGSVPAARLALQLLEKGAAAVPIGKAKSPPAQAKAEKLGKKEQALVDATSAHEGTSWATRLN